MNLQEIRKHFEEIVSKNNPADDLSDIRWLIKNFDDLLRVAECRKLAWKDVS